MATTTKAWGETKGTNNYKVTCYGLVRTANAQQEWYESATRDAGRRANFLRACGFTVTTSATGTQVTRVGLVKMTLLTIHRLDRFACPPAPGRVKEL